MAKAWQDLAAKYAAQHKTVRIGEVDCTNQNELCMNQNINAYPTLILFRSGGVRIAQYASGGRDLDSLASFLNSYLEHDDL